MHDALDNKWMFNTNVWYNIAHKMTKYVNDNNTNLRVHQKKNNCTFSGYP